MPYADPSQKRGRPRKVVTETVPAVKRPRGRPRKDTTTSESSRGRPRKNKTNIIALCAEHAVTCRILQGTISVVTEKHCVVCGNQQ